MTTRNAILRTAQGELGYKEKGNNITKYWQELYPQFQGAPWCAAFTAWVYKQNGSDLLLTGPSAPYYTPSMEAWAKKTGRWKMSKDCSPGDVLIFGGSGAVHTGILEKQDGRDHVISIEGNTSSGYGGSQTDGGGVYRRRRPRSWIRGGISMTSEITSTESLGGGQTASVSAPASRPRTRGPFPLPRGHFYGKDKHLDRNHSGYYVRDREAIRQIQAVVGVGQDGGFGPKTHDAVVAWQRSRKLEADGRVGPLTWAAMGAGR